MLILINLSFYALRLTWPFPPHSPAGDFAPGYITTLLSRLNRQDLLLGCAMLIQAFCQNLRGSLCPHLTWTFNHRPSKLTNCT